MTMDKPLKLDDLNKQIDALNTSATKLQASYQDVGLMTLAHLAAHGDVGPVNRLVMGMPKGTRKLAMATWMLAHGAIKLNDDRDTRTTMAFKFDKTKKTDVEGAMASPWFDAAPPREISDTFDVQVAFKALLNRCKGKTLLVGGEPHKHQAETALKAMAAAVGLPYDDGSAMPADGRRNPGSAMPKTAADAVGAAAPTSTMPPAKSEAYEPSRMLPVAAKTAAAKTPAKKAASKV
jgi:hypothetical protein